MPTAYDATHPLPIGVLISGGGTTLANLIERLSDGRLRNIAIRIVISSRSNVRGVEIARAANLPVHIVRRRECADDAVFGNEIAERLRFAGIELTVMAGFLCFWPLPPDFEHRVLNIHPALLPAFGGRGMYGGRVHAAVLASGTAESGCTVHLVDNEYDHGPIVAQRRVSIRAGDTPETLAARVAVEERELYPQVIQAVADHGLRWLREFASGGASTLNA